MSIIRLKSHTKYFVILCKKPLNDENLSWKAKGIWSYLMSLPDDWKISATEVASHGLGGPKVVLSALHELCKQGYVQKIDPQRQNGKFIGGSWVIYESKQHLPRTEKGHPAKRHPATGQLLRTERVRTERVIKSKPKEVVASPVAQRLARTLFSNIQLLNPKAKIPNFRSWGCEIDKLMKTQNVTEDEINSLLQWLAQNEFWRKNILSGLKLRVKYDSLVASMNSPDIKSYQPNNVDRRTQNIDGTPVSSPVDGLF